MPDAVPVFPLYARAPGSGPTPKGIYHDPATSQRMAKVLLKAMRPMLKGKARGKSKVKHPTHVKSVQPVRSARR